LPNCRKNFSVGGGKLAKEALRPKKFSPDINQHLPRLERLARAAQPKSTKDVEILARAKP